MSSNFALPRPLRRSGSLPASRTIRIVVLGQGAVGKTDLDAWVRMRLRSQLKLTVGPQWSLVHITEPPRSYKDCLIFRDDQDSMAHRGCSAMTVRFITKRFIREYDPTLETIYRHEAAISGEVVHFEILDTAGQEEDALLIEEKIKWGDGFVIVYSVTDRCSFDEVIRLCFLVNHIHSNSRKGSSDPPSIVIVANKRDLEFDRMVTTEDGENLSKALKHPFCEVSTRDSYEETVVVFHTLYSEMMKQLSSSPTSFRRRAVSKLMDKIPKIHANSTLGSTGRSFSFNSFRDLLPE